MKLLWRVVLVFCVFLGVGLLVFNLVASHVAENGTPVSQIRLASATAGLFAGSIAAAIVLLILAFGKRR